MRFSIASRYFLATWIVGIACTAASQLKNLQINHRTKRLSDGQVKYLSSLRNVAYTNEVLDNILIPRVIGTPKHEEVFRYLSSELQNLNWDVEVDEFQTRTPIFGVVKFKNIVATLNPKADRYLVIACHYDSKYFENQQFVGAVDSAVPCAMMLNLAKTLNSDLQQIRNSTNLSIKLLFLDGEEAVLEWGPKDSIYGARHLAAKYHHTKEVTSQGEDVSRLEKIDLFVLLDLIGHTDTSFSDQVSTTSHWYSKLVTIESRLKTLGIINPRKGTIFKRQTGYGIIEDDHIPFMRKGVPIVHLISTPFPPEWHTPNDNRDIVDIELVENMNAILRIFVAEYLNLLVP